MLSGNSVGDHRLRGEHSMIKARKIRRAVRGEKVLEAAGVPGRHADYKTAAVIFAQGDPGTTVMFIKKGTVKLSVVSNAGKEAVVGLLKSGDFVGEGCLAGQSRRMATATALTPTTMVVLDKQEMTKRLHESHDFTDRFLSHMLSRNIRVEEDLVDQLFNSSEKRLARALLLLARYGEHEKPQRVLPKVSQELLAEMVGTTRSRVNFFMNKFRRLGFIDYNGGLRIDNSLLSVVLHD
jgi:CRP/FNR family transcriptional regulator, cyclic AMP receptor protein